MNFSIRKTIREFVAPDARLSCPQATWRRVLHELRRRGGSGRTESGAFLLGKQDGKCQRVRRFVYYDDLDPDCLKSGAVVIDGGAYGPLWRICQESGLRVVADVHTHPGAAIQSSLDRDNPMIATQGHVAIIVPNFADRYYGAAQCGIYEYQGSHLWRDWSGDLGLQFFYLGMWG